MRHPTHPADPDTEPEGGVQPTPSRLPLVIAVALILSGAVWMLQGLGILTTGRSFMIGDHTWVVIGAATIVVGIGLGWWARSRRSQPR